MRVISLFLLLFFATRCFSQNFIEQHNLPTVQLNSLCKPFYKNSCGELFYVLTSANQAFDSLAVYNENTHLLNTYYLPDNIVMQVSSYTHMLNNSLSLATSCTKLYIAGTAGIIEYNNGTITYFPYPTGFNYTVNQLTYKFNKLYIATNQGILKLDNSAISIETAFPSNYNYAGIEGFNQSNKMLLILNSVLYVYDGTTFTILNTGNFNLQNVKCIRADNSDGIYFADRTNKKFYYINSQLNITEISVTSDLCDLYMPRYWSSSGANLNTFGLNKNSVLIYDDNYRRFVTINKSGEVFSYNPEPISVGVTNPSYNYFFNSPDSIYYTGSTLLSNLYNGKYYTLNLNKYEATLTNLRNMVCKRLDINNVSSLIANRGDANFGMTNGAQFFAPKADAKSTIFSTGIFIGGIDDNGILHRAVSDYRGGAWTNTNPNMCDFWPGPIDTINATVDSIKSNAYNKVWKINKADVDNFIFAYQNGQVQNGTYTPAPDFITWPCGDSGNYAKKLAPFFDNNNDGKYNYLDGDYPKIKGDQAAYVIFNDALADHSLSNGLVLGIEVHLMAYEYLCLLNGANNETAINNTVFYDYKIINRSNNNYHNMSIAIFEDGDIGGYLDDYAGCRPKYNYGFEYNSDNFDEPSSAITGYGLNPPIQNNVVLNGPLAPINDNLDNNNNGTIDEAGEKCLMTSFFTMDPAYLWATSSANNMDTVALNSYLFSNAKYMDSTHVMYGGTGYGPSGTTTNVPTNFMFDGINEDVNSPFYGMAWTESIAGITGEDRIKIIGCSGFELPAKQNVNFEYANVFVWNKEISYMPQEDTASNYWKNNHNNVLRVIDIYNHNVSISCDSITNVSAREITGLNSLSIYPNPAQNTLYINGIPDFENASCLIYSITGSLVIEQRLKINSVNTANLTPGLYMIQVRTKNGFSNLKFVKE